MGLRKLGIAPPGVLWGPDPEAPVRARALLGRVEPEARSARLGLLRAGSWWLTRTWLLDDKGRGPRVGELDEIWSDPGEAFVSWWNKRERGAPVSLFPNPLALLGRCVTEWPQARWVAEAFGTIEGLAGHLDAGWELAEGLEGVPAAVARRLAGEWSGTVASLVETSEWLAERGEGRRMPAEDPGGPWRPVG